MNKKTQHLLKLFIKIFVILINFVFFYLYIFECTHLKLAFLMYIYVYIYIYIYIYIVAIESWPEWDLNPQPLKFHSDIWNSVQLALRANFVQLLQCHLFFQCLCFISVFAFISHYICFKHSLTQVIMLVAE